MSAVQKGMVTGAGIVVAALSIFAAGVSIAGGSNNLSTPSPAENARLTIAHRSIPVTTLMHWDVSKGPDPFALPRRPVREVPSTPLRKQLHIGSPIYWQVTGRTGDLRKSPVVQEAEVDPSQLRMAGYLSGNGVYAVLQTPEETVVVNPGDKLDDGRRVTEIRPRQTKLERDGTIYDVEMHD